ncbi:DoxX family protein [Halovivax cerinus]|uniref:DoxX family protein n=1 Tax=Halovivax cerinus TaxID=1487865 RepID=A0ABD5NMJ2_9EURY|nr:DoxX family protein [Halovivax cerinus]
MYDKTTRIESSVGGFTAVCELHGHATWFILALRLLMGATFVEAGLSKVFAGDFTARGYLAGREAGPAADLFVSASQVDWFVAFVDVAVPWGELFVGLGLLVGALTRLAAFWGTIMTLLYYLGNWDAGHGYATSDLLYALVFLSLAAFGAGRIAGLDRYVERYRVDGRPLVERYPRVRYLLG